MEPRYHVEYSRQAIKDSYKLKDAHLDLKVQHLINILKHNPYQNPPPYEKLKGDRKDQYSRRLNLHHRLTYTVDEGSKTVHIARMWEHYK